MGSIIKVELERSKLQLEFYKARNDQDPNKIYTKWVEIYADRVVQLERQLAKLERQVAAPKATSTTSLQKAVAASRANKTRKAGKTKSRASARR